MKGRKKGLERKTAPRPDPVDGNVKEVFDLFRWAQYGPDLDQSIVAYFLLTDSPYVREEIRQIFAERAAEAFESLDDVFFTRVANSISRIKAAGKGEVFDPRGCIVIGGYLELRRKLYDIALEAREPDAFEKEDALMDEGRFEEYLKFRREVFDQTGARKLPTASEVIQECEKDPKWPKVGDQKKYTYDLLKKFGLPYLRAKGGRPKKARAPK